MKEEVYLASLYDYYKGLLTEKQREYFEDYYFDNMSFSEMAEDYEVSRNAAFKQVHIVMEKLDEYESKLQLYKKRNELLKISSKIDDEKIKEELENLF